MLCDPNDKKKDILFFVYEKVFVCVFLNLHTHTSSSAVYSIHLAHYVQMWPQTLCCSAAVSNDAYLHASWFCCHLCMGLEYTVVETISTNFVM